jgi:hypothetical protein
MIAALSPALAPDAYVPIRILHLREGIVAAYSPEQIDRPTVWRALVEMFGQLTDASAVTS